MSLIGNKGLINGGFKFAPFLMTESIPYLDKTETYQSMKQKFKLLDRKRKLNKIFEKDDRDD